jgi:hypothetical protein
MAATVQDLTEVIQRYRSHYGLDRKINDLCGGNKADVAALLWTARKQGAMTLEQGNHTLYLFPGAPHLWDGDDLCELVEELQRYHPDGAFSGSASSWVGALAGTAGGLREMIREKAGDAAFAATLRARWATLPEFWATGVGFYLVAFGHMPHTALTPEVRRAIARASLERGELDHWRTEPGWPAEAWARQLIEVGVDDAEAFLLEQNKVLLALDRYASLEELLACMRRCSSRSDLVEAIAALRDRGPGALAAMERALLAAEVPDRTTGSASCPALAILLLYLRHCEAAGRAPAEALDPTLQAVIDGFYIGWGGGHFREFMLELHRLIRIFPAARLERALLRAEPFCWPLAPACPTPAVLQVIADGVAALPARGDYSTDRLVDEMLAEGYNNYGEYGLFYEIREALVPSFVAGLKAKKPAPRRQVFLSLLLQAASPEAAEGVVFALGDSSKSIRERAIAGAIGLGVEACLPWLPEVLASRRKDGRLAAAAVLAGLPADARVRSLAEARLGAEKDAAVRAALEAVPAPAGGARAEDRTRKLLDGDGDGWRALDSEGLLDDWWRALALRFNEKEIDVYSGLYKGWLELLESRRTEPAAMLAGIRLLAAFDTYWGRSYLEKLDALFPGALPGLLTRALAEGLERPPEFGRRRFSFGAKEAIAWAGKPERRERFVGVLVAGLGDRRRTVVKAATEALLAGGEGLRVPLEGGLAHPSPAVKAAAAGLLERLASPDSAAALEAALAGASGATRAAIARALGACRAAALEPGGFPDSAEGDQALDAALAALAPGGGPAPALRWRRGGALSEGARAWVAAALARESLEVRTPALAALRPRLDDRDCEALLESILKANPAHGGFSGAAIFSRALLGGPEQIDAVAARLETLAGSQRTKWGDEGVEALARAGTPAAIRHLERAWQKGRRDALKGRAGEALRRLAGRRGLSVEDLLDSAISDFGFDRSGQRTLDFGGRVYTLRLTADNTLQLLDEQGNLRGSPPSPRQGDGVTQAAAAQAAAARREYSAIKKAIGPIHTAQKRRLEEALAARRGWPAATWLERFRDHPLMQAFGRSLVWEALGGDAPQRFTLTHDRELVDLELDEVSLAAGAVVRLAHPLELSAGERARWAGVLADQEALQPFPQLERRTFVAADLPADKDLFVGLPMVVSGTFMGRLARLGFDRGGREDAGLINTSHRSFGEWQFVLHHSGYHPETPTDGQIEIERITASRGGRDVPWRSVAPVAFSEIARALHLLMEG